MKRLFAVLILLSLFVLIWLPQFVWRTFEFALPPGIVRNVSLCVFSLATLGILLNVHLSWVRPILHKRKQGSMENYKHISGIPIIPSLLVIIAALMLTPRIWPCILATILLLLDTGSPIWFVIMTWKDDSLYGPSIRRKK